jgi:cytochrome c oxidase cbb3-type subunit 3
LSRPAFGESGMAAEYQAELRAAAKAAPAPRPGGPANVALVALADEPSLSKGRAIFEGPDNACASCHRPDLGGMIGPDLTDQYWLHGCALPDIVTSIKTGYPMKGMLPFGSNKPLTDEQLLQVASYVMSKHGSSPAAAKPIDRERDVACGRGD